MSRLDLRPWLEERGRAHDVQTIVNAHWDQEIFCVTKLHRDARGGKPALLFDQVEGYPRGLRVLCRSLDSKERAALALGLNPGLAGLELLRMTREKLLEWEALMGQYPPQVVKSGPILENVME